ncbi:MAG TPA: NapC/NirT family cytochrome c [Ignavibacteriales bacterium]|nr:NapC/NirT family cytochrome c [Ignavibacteriales bacterium]
MKLKLPHSTQNWISVIGAVTALVSFFMIVFLFAVSAFLESENSYIGLVIYIALPAVMILGLLLIPLGMYIKTKSAKRLQGPERKGWPVLDFNDARHRNAFAIFAVGTSIFLLASALGSYEAFHFTESVEFCGKICHETMKPEFTAYQNSPHARVACVECHVGTGAGWYVRSKLSGLYQVYAVTFGKIPRPIETPITNLRPARETCEECHWPQKFYSRKLITQKHYLADEQNSEWDITLTMKTGSSISALSLEEGIHWHINPDVRIEYKAADKKRESIPWVKYTNLKTGKISIYKSTDNDLTAAQLDSLETRTMDCMDCHNRPSHNYRPPALFINDAITTGKIPKELPQIKFAALEVIGREFSSTDSAMTEISNYISAFYKDNYPDEFANNKSLIDKAINGIQNEFSRNIFPEMKVRWNVYPNNIGHLEFMGCFRCHNDNHQSESGAVISKDCNLCHSINAQGPPDNMETAPVNTYLEFKHPGDAVGEDWKDMLCVDCHTGLNP